LVPIIIFRIFRHKIKVMALWKFTNLNKHGNYKTRIIYTKGTLSIPGDGLGKVIFANRFKYKYEHPLIPPMIWKNNGKTYLMPLWKEVVEGTTLNDIEWVKPKAKKAEIIQHKFESSSSDKVYITKEYIEIDGSRKYSCNCPGVWRSKDRKCKHIKSIEKKYILT
jgi:hypothetical protein